MKADDVMTFSRLPTNQDVVLFKWYHNGIQLAGDVKTILEKENDMNIPYIKSRWKHEGITVI